MLGILPYLHEYYHIDKLGDITWAHAVNNQERFQQALHDPRIMVMETDVMLSARGEIIMAHPPARDSDLSFKEFIQSMARSKQAIKLDFKNPGNSHSLSTDAQRKWPNAACPAKCRYRVGELCAKV